MSFLIHLTPSPVHEAFAGIQWDPLEKLELSDPDKALLRAAEDNPLDYTLADQHDAEAYAQVLLKVIDQSIANPGKSPSRSSSRRESSNLRVSQIPLEQSLPDDEALQYLYSDSMGVVLHYAIEKLYSVIQALKSCRLTAKVTLATTFYPSGIFIDNWRPLWRMLSGSLSDPFAQRGAAYCLACILLTGCTFQQHDPTYTMFDAEKSSSLSPILESFVSWMSSRLQSSTSSVDLAIVTPSLTVMMVHRQARQAFDAAGGVGYLSRHLRVDSRKPSVPSSSNSSLDGSEPMTGRGTVVQRSNASGVNGGGITTAPFPPSRRMGASVQRLYELTYCLWLLSYDLCPQENEQQQDSSKNGYSSSHRLRKHFLRDGAISSLCELVVAAPREKVVRLALSTLRNLAVCTTATMATVTTSTGAAFGQDAFRREMVACGLLKPVERMLERQWNDPDIVHDLELLSQALRDTFQHMTTWDVYQSEVESSHLHWGIVHTEKFFRENIMRMEGKDGKFSIVKTLIALAASEDEEVAAIACYDIGEFARHYPNGRSLVKRLGARNVVLGLIEHDNPELQHQALVSVSKMLVLHWQAVK